MKLVSSHYYVYCTMHQPHLPLPLLLLLLLLQVDINRVNRAGMSALHCAGMFGQTRTAKFLLRVGANKFLKDNEGRTAAAVAMDW